MKSTRHDQPYKNYHWIAVNPKVLGGKPIVRGTRFSVAFILGCFAEGMAIKEIEKTYGSFPKEAIPDIFRFAEELASKPVRRGHVVA